MTITIKETIKIIKAVEPLSFATKPNTNKTGPKMYKMFSIGSLSLVILLVRYLHK